MKNSFVINCCALLCAFSACVAARGDTPTGSSPQASQKLDQGWQLLMEGEAQATIEQDAKHPGSDSPHLLKITVAKTAGPQKGRGGALNDTPLVVQAGVMYDAVFSATTERGSVGLVFSLETPEGKVLARTTQAEFGRGRRRGPPGTEQPETGSTFSKVRVALKARGSDNNARLTIVPIDPTTVWLDEITLVPRDATAKDSASK